MEQIYRRIEGRRRRISSYDRTGGNADWYEIKPHETRDFAEFKGEGIVKHIWITMANFGRVEEFLLRKTGFCALIGTERKARAWRRP